MLHDEIKQTRPPAYTIRYTQDNGLYCSQLTPIDQSKGRLSFSKGPNKDQRGLEKDWLWKSNDYTGNIHKHAPQWGMIVHWLHCEANNITNIWCVSLNKGPNIVCNKQTLHTRPVYISEGCSWRGGAAHFKHASIHCCEPFGLHKILCSELGEFKVRFFLLYLRETMSSAAYCKEQSSGET